MTLGGKSTPVYVVSDDEITSGRFTVAPGPAVAVSVLDVTKRGVLGGNCIPVYVIDDAQIAVRGLRGGLEGLPVTDIGNFRPVSGLQQAIPVYVVEGSLDSGSDPATEVRSNITAFHPLHEFGGNRYDCVGSYDVTEIGGDVGYKADSTFPYSALFSPTARLRTIDTTPGLSNNASDPFSVAAWVNLSSFSSAQIICSLYANSGGTGNWLLYVNSSGDVFLRIWILPHASPYIVDGYASSKVQLNNWHFIAAVFNVDSIEVSVDGEQFNSTPFNYTIKTYDMPFVIGGGYDFSTQSVDGYLRHIMYFKNYAISQDAVTWLYNSGAGRAASEITSNPCVPSLMPPSILTNTKAWWPFNNSLEDVHANHDFTEAVNPVSYTPGSYNDAVQTTLNEYLTQSDDPDLKTGNRSWFMCGLLHRSAVGSADMQIASKTGEFFVEYQTANNRTQFTTYGASGQIATVLLSHEIAVGDTVWIGFGYDADNDKIFIQINDDYGEATPSATPVDDVNDLALGLDDASFDTWDGWFDEWMMVTDYAPTSTEMDDIRNNNVHMDYARYIGYFYGFDNNNYKFFDVWRPPDDVTSSDMAADFPADWRDAIGLADDLRVINAYIWPAGTLKSGAVFQNKVEISGDDMWAAMRCRVSAAWTDADYIGVTVRHSESAETYYGFWTDDDTWELTAVVSGSLALLATGTHTVADDDVYELRAEGTTITAYINDSQVAQVSNSSITGGKCGMICQGIGGNNRVQEFRCGELPKGNVAKRNSWLTNRLQSDSVISSCFTSNEELVADGDYATNTSHAVDHTHYIEIDLGELFMLSKIRMNSNLSTAPEYDWDDFDIYTKKELADDWVGVAYGLDADNDGVAGWKHALIKSIPVARYVRIEVNSTLHASNTLATSEIEFWV